MELPILVLFFHTKVVPNEECAQQAKLLIHDLSLKFSYRQKQISILCLEIERFKGKGHISKYRVRFELNGLLQHLSEVFGFQDTVLKQNIFFSLFDLRSSCEAITFFLCDFPTLQTSKNISQNTFENF